MAPDVVVVGQLVRDLVLCADGIPGPGGTAPVRLRREMLGGKGANQAVALAQLGRRPMLVAVAGDDEVGDQMLAQARGDGIDVGYVVRREGTRTGLIVDLLPGNHRWRYLEDVPEAVLLTGADLARAAPVLGSAGAVLVQLQQPTPVALAALRYASAALTVLDGCPANLADRDALLAAADVVRADAAEARTLTGHPLDTADDALRAARELLRHGPRLVALAAGELGNVFAWAEGEVFLPLLDEPVVDTTGAGDAFVAALTTALLHSEKPEWAARLAVTAAGMTAGHPGGRPDLTMDRLAATASRVG